ncbi:MAG: PTS transporter subunit EIIB [Streptococcus thermophilus]
MIRFGHNKNTENRPACSLFYEYRRKCYELQRNRQKILEAVGGKENVQNLTHCATRLRFT